MLVQQHLQPLLPNMDDSSYLIDQLNFMQEQESSSLYQCTDYLSTCTTTSTKSSSSSSSSNSSCKVSSSDRRTMCSWSYDIVDACSIDREIAVIGMTYFDRFMSLVTSSSSASASDNTTNNNTNNNMSPYVQSRRSFQLAYITCLIIALKCRGGMQVDSDFVSTTICQGLYTPNEIIHMECFILQTLEWRLNGPSCHEFVNGLLELLPSIEGMKDEIKKDTAVLIERCMLDYELATCVLPSRIAYAALLTVLSRTSSMNPLVRMSLTENIIHSVMGMRCTDYEIQRLCDQMMMMMEYKGCEDVAVPVPTVDCHSTIGAPSTPPPPKRSQAVIEGYTFCTPVNSSLSSSSTSIQMNHDEYDELYLESLSRPSSSLVHEGYNTTSSNDFTEYFVCRDYAYGEHLYLDMLSMTSVSESSSTSSTCSGATVISR